MMQRFVMYLFPCGKSGNAVAGGQNLPMRLVLKTYNFNLGTAIDANHDSPLGYGSKFPPADVLQSVFNLHPNWL
jgi:hypothetical protein